jgi:uncharacterized LabA/DUF88 family protein
VPDRAILFVDGNNWYHGLKSAGVAAQRQLDHRKIAQKLVGPRTWTGTRYYIGQVQQVGNRQLYADQRSFLADLQATDKRITVHLGRLEPRQVQSNCADELHAYLGQLQTRIDTRVFHDLMDLARRHRSATVMVEKAVDVMLAVDLVTLAAEYDAAYILSADGDYTHAAKHVRALGKKVYAAAASPGAQLAAVVNSFIRLDASWFADCYR